MSEFQYFYTQQATGTFEIEDLGNFAISCTNDIYHEYIMLVKTEYGVTKVITFGPNIIDQDTPNDTVDCKFQQFDFSQYKIEKMVDKFVNEAKRVITQVTVIDQKDALERIKDVTSYL